eukprot:TRINITY_DN3167_c0_g1_i1.p1 TRINITY_DN3167_c0_g1~~TRINITY_DN3167_c0_g1_i1.p1  ORF type:complete len:700 (+),score=84.82 TRINITY_DN3167_c0_g1_i1:493-2592(+)
MLPPASVMSGLPGSVGLDSPRQQPPLAGTRVIGTPGSPSYRVLFASDASSIISPWHDIPLISPRGGFSCVCTTPAGSWVKYCLADEPLDPLRVQRESATPAVPRLSSSYLSSSPHTPSFYSPTSGSNTPTFLSNPATREVSPSYGTTASRPTSPLYPHHTGTSPLSQCSDPRYSGSPRTPFSAFSASFSSDEGDRSHKDIVDLLALDVIGRPAHFTENASWHCGFLPQTSVMPSSLFSESSLRGVANQKSPLSPLVSHPSYQFPRKNPPSDSCPHRTVSAPNLDNTNHHKTSEELEIQKPRPPHPTIQIPTNEDLPKRERLVGQNRPLDIMELGCFKERSPGEVFEVRPLATFVWKPRGGAEEPLAIVVMAMDNPIEPLLDDGDFFQALVPGVLEKMRVWLERQQRANLEDIDGVSRASSIRVETSFKFTTAAMSTSHKMWQSQFKEAVQGTPPISLPSLDENSLTCLWDTYTRGSSSHLAHVAIPLSKPKGPSRKRDSARVLSNSRSYRLTSDPSNGNDFGAGAPRSHSRSPSADFGARPFPLVNSRSHREGRSKSCDDFESDAESVVSCSEASLSPSLSPSHHSSSSFAFSTPLALLKAYLPSGKSSAKEGSVASPTKSGKMKRWASKALGSPNGNVETRIHEKVTHKVMEEASPTLFGVFERRPRDKGVKTTCAVETRPKTTHILRSSACEHEHPL